MANVTLTNIGGRLDNNNTTVRVGASSGGVVYDDACWSFSVPNDDKIKSYNEISFTFRWNDENYASRYEGYVVGITTVGSTGRGSGDQDGKEKNIYQIDSGIIVKNTYAIGSSNSSRSYSFTFSGLELIPGTTYYIRANNPNKGTYKNVSTSVEATLSGITYKYSSCSAPTSLISTELIPAQGNVITLNWEGAQSGINNPITGYQLRWKMTAASEYTFSKKIVTSGSSGSSGWTAGTIGGSWIPGTKIEISVQTIGTVTGYDSDYSSPIYITINTAPTWNSSPSLEQTEFYKGFSGSVNLTSLEAVDIDGDGIKYYYSTSNDFSTASQINGKTITISNDPTTIYFWASDEKNQSEVRTITGLEYKSIDPGDLIVTTNNTYTAGDVNYSKSFTITAGTPEYISKYRFYYGRGAVPDVRLTEQQSETYYIPNIYELRPNDYPLPGISWSFGVEFVYEIGGNESVSEMKIVAMNAFPSVGRITRVTESASFSDKIVCTLPDTGITQLEVAPFGVSYELDIPNRQVILDTSRLTNGVTYNFSITPHRNNQRGTTNSFTATKFYTLSFQNITFSTTVAFPHNYPDDASVGTFNLYFTNPFTSLDPLDYGITSAEDIEILVGYGGRNYNLSQNKQLKLSEWDANTYNGFLSKSIPLNFFNIIAIESGENLGIVDYTGQYPLTFSLTANGVTTSASISFILNFDKAPIITDFSVSSNNNINLIQRDDILTYTISFDCYNSYPINTNINIARIKNQLDNKNWTSYTTNNNSGYSSTSTLATPIRQTISFTKKVEQITDSNYIVFSARLSSVGSSYGNSDTEEWNPAPAPLPISVKHTSPGLIISGGSYSNGTLGLNYSFSQDDKGIYIQNQTQGYVLESFLETSSSPTFDEVISNLSLSIGYNSNSTGTQKVTYSDFPGSFVYARVKTTTYNTSTKQRDFYSNVLTIFNETPTISYRKNHLGINYKLPTTIEDDSPYKNAILVIGQTNDRNEIHYVGTDLGHIYGFLIDGGTWDL